MKKNLLCLLSLFLLISFIGCAGKGARLSINDYPDIRPAEHQIQFTGVNGFTTDAWMTPERKTRWQENYTSKVRESDFSKIWQEITNQSPALFGKKENPEYTANIELSAVMTGFHKHNPMNLNWHGLSLVKITVLDQQSKPVHVKFIKTYGLWTGNGMGKVEGPAAMGFSYPNHAIARLGLYDAIAYVCRGDFLSKASGGVEYIEHMLPGEKPNRKIIDLPFLTERLILPSTTYYDPIFGALIYSRHIMAEDFTTSDLMRSDPYIQAAAKLGKVANWPYFPVNLSVDSVVTNFE